MQKSKDFDKPRIAEGFYHCECKEVKRVSDGQYGERIAFICKILEKDVDLVKVVYLKLTPDTGCMAVLEAFGVEFVEGEKFNFENMQGKVAIAVVEDYVYQHNGEERCASTITKFKPDQKQEEEVVA